MFERIYSPAIDTMNAMNAIADPDCTRDAMAGFYEDLIHCANVHGTHSIDWKKINEAIVKRWPKGLEYIKTKAWKRVESRRA